MINITMDQEQYDEYVAQKNKIKDLEELVDYYRRKAIAADGMHHHECIKNHELEVRNESLKESLDSIYKNYQQALSDKAALIEERDRLKAENHDLKAKIKEPVATIKINPCRDLEKVYPPASILLRNKKLRTYDGNSSIKVENLYITNNYFSEEDKSNE